MNDDIGYEILKVLGSINATLKEIAAGKSSEIQQCHGVTSSERLLDITEIAAFTGTTERMARRMIDQRQVPTVKVGRYVRVKESDLLNYITGNTRPANES